MLTKANLRQKKADGFTIIEVLIVLAIAGIISLIVFQAVPSLTRNARNSNRKNDVNEILSAVSRYQLNHSGTVFPDICSTTPGSASCIDPVMSFTYTRLTLYPPNSSAFTFNPRDVGQPNEGPNNDTKTVNLYNHQKCAADTSGTSTSNGASYYDVVALYALETNNVTGQAKCQQL